MSNTYDASDFPRFFSMPGCFSFEATALIRAIMRTVSSDFAVQNSWDNIEVAHSKPGGTHEGKQTIRVRYRITRGGEHVCKFYFFVKASDGHADPGWTCVGETGPRRTTAAPAGYDDDIRWY